MATSKPVLDLFCSLDASISPALSLLPIAAPFCYHLGTCSSGWPASLDHSLDTYCQCNPEVVPCCTLLHRHPLPALQTRCHTCWVSSQDRHLAPSTPLCQTSGCPSQGLLPLACVALCRKPMHHAHQGSSVLTSLPASDASLDLLKVIVAFL